MRGELRRKTTRTVHGMKVVRLRIDIPMGEINGEEEGNQDILHWLDAHVDRSIKFQVGPFSDQEQTEIEDILGHNIERDLDSDERVEQL